ncbi:PH domain-containing protein [Streptomyces sodiiphilus]|uniref:PH domain-containing protein n=1 Tax=Streptomyces sodiiphilus TaxID=226217 RepID=A0ABP5B3W1_9ACTN
MDTVADGPQQDGGERPGTGEWLGVRPGLLTMRRLLLALWLGPVVATAAVLPALLGAPRWSLLGLLPAGIVCWAWWVLGRNWRSWRYLERADDLLIRRGILWRQLTVVPYGRMQLVEVTSGPLERRFGLSRLQLHTAAAATDAAIPGLDPAEAERLRDRLTELGEARSAGL